MKLRDSLFIIVCVSIVLHSFVDAFVDLPKPLIGVINGPALGIAATTLALYDVVYSTDKVSTDLIMSYLS